MVGPRSGHTYPLPERPAAIDLQVEKARCRGSQAWLSVDYFKQAGQVPPPASSETESPSSNRPKPLPLLRLSGQRGIREPALMGANQVEPDTMGGHLETPPTEMRLNCVAFFRVALNN